MDVVLHLADEYILDSVWAALWPAHFRGASIPKPATPSQSAVANLSTHLSGWGAQRVLETEWGTHAGKAMSALPRDSMIR